MADAPEPDPLVQLQQQVADLTQQLNEANVQLALDDRVPARVQARVDDLSVRLHETQLQLTEQIGERENAQIITQTMAVQLATAQRRQRHLNRVAHNQQATIGQLRGMVADLRERVDEILAAVPAQEPLPALVAREASPEIPEPGNRGGGAEGEADAEDWCQVRPQFR